MKKHTRFKNWVSGEVVVASIEHNGWALNRLYVLTENTTAPNTLIYKTWHVERTGNQTEVGSTSNLDDFLIDICYFDLEDALMLRGKLHQQELQWVLKHQVD